jgi:putative FmdB family regulatory protein
MPIYTYRCDKCEIQVTKIISMDARDEQVCDGCKEKFKRMIDRPGLVWAPTAGGMR